MAYNDYSNANTLFRLELNTEVAYKLLGKIEKKNLDVLNRFLKIYFIQKFGANEVRFMPIQAQHEILTVESLNYNKLKEVYERFTGNSLLAFDISDQVDKVLDWLEQKSCIYKIDTVFGKDISIVFEEPAVAMEFKLRFAAE